MSVLTLIKQWQVSDKLQVYEPCAKDEGLTNNRINLWMLWNISPAILQTLWKEERLFGIDQSM